MWVSQLAIILSLKCWGSFLSVTILKKKPFVLLGNFSSKNLAFPNKSSMSPFTSPTIKLLIFGISKKEFLKTASFVLTKITSGEWVVQVLAVLAQKFFMIMVLM